MMASYGREPQGQSLPSIYKPSTLFKDLGIKLEQDMEHRSFSPTCARNVSELQDQLKSYREDIKKKDDMIQKLCCMQTASGSAQKPEVKLVPAPPNRNELAALQVRIDTLEDKLRRRQVDVETRDETIAVLKKEIDLVRQDNGRLTAECETLSKNVAGLENVKATFEGLKSRNEYAVTALQEQNRSAQERIVELETRLRTQLGEREKKDQTIDSMEKKHQDFLHQIARLSCVVDITQTDSMLAKLTDISQRDALLQSKIASLTETVNTRDSELKEARDTITRLSGQFGALDQGRNVWHETNSRLSAEKADQEAKAGLLEKRLDATQKLLSDCQKECEKKHAKIIELECQVREKTFGGEAVHKQMTALIESLAAIIGTPYAPCPATEAAVKERVQTLVKDVREQSSAAQSLDQRVLALQKQFETQYESGKDVISRLRQTELDKQTMGERIKLLENDLSARDLLREGIKAEKERVHRLLQKLADKLEVDYLPGDCDPEGLASCILARCEQSRLMEPAQCCHHHHLRQHSPPPPNQQHLTTALREQIQSRDIQLETLRRRLAELELGRSGTARSCAAEETARDRVCRLGNQLEEARCEIAQLKHQLRHSEEAQLNAHQEKDDMDQLSKSVEKLEFVRQRQARKIVGLKSRLELDENKLGSMQKMAAELKQSRNMLLDTRRREQELADFRNAIGQQLGVDVRCTPHPESDIVTRLQRLLAMFSRSGAASMGTQQYQTPSYVQQLGPQFQSGYENAMIPFSQPVSFQGPIRSSQRSPTDPKRGSVRLKRARSSSPPAKRDERKY